jgi:GNAT superfamily N-acetyltransferase
VDIEGPVPFDPRRHDVSRFDCGSPAQTDWLRRIARQAEAVGTARVYVVAEVATGRVIGYHALAASAVRPEDAPASLLRGAGRSPVPTILLARLGVDASAQGLGLGAALVKDAMLRAHQAARTIGARALLIHAESQQARDFYLHLAEFDESPTDPLHLVLLMSTIAEIAGT